MKGVGERQYSAHSKLSRGAIQKAKRNGRMVLYADDSINASASPAGSWHWPKPVPAMDICTACRHLVYQATGKRQGLDVWFLSERLPRVSCRNFALTFQNLAPCLVFFGFNLAACKPLLQDIKCV